MNKAIITRFIVTVPIVLAVIGGYWFDEFLSSFNVPNTFIAIATLLIISPMLEELVFRGLLQDFVTTYKNKFAKQIQPYIIVLLPNIFFTMWHIHVNHNPLYLVLIFLAGCAFGVIKLFHNQLIYSMLLHSYYNLVFLILLYTMHF